MANPGDFAYTVKQQADIVQIVGEYVKLKKSGAQNYTGLCPFHSEKTGSFSVHATRQFYHCFGCGDSGDVFKFVQKIENITFPEAVRAVAQKVGIPLPKVEYSSPQEAREARQRGGLIDIHEKTCAWFEQQLRRPEAAHAREYLKSRGLKDETIARFRIGYAPEHGFALRDALRRDFDDELMRASGLFSWKEQGSATSGATGDGGATAALAVYSKFRNRIMFPITNETGKVIAFTGRTLATDEKAGPKYLNSPETPIYSKSHVLFNLDNAKDAIRKLDYVILVEGQMDCISVYAAGLHNVIASSGTAFTEPQARLIGRFTKNIVVNFDPDTAGAAAAERSLALLVQEEFQIKVLTLEQGYDPDLFVRKKGVQAYGTALKEAPKYFDYLIDRARAQFPHTPEGKVKAVNFLMPHVQRIPSRIVRDELANEIAQKLGIESSVLRQELRQALGSRAAAKIAVPKVLAPSWTEERLIRLLADDVAMPAERAHLVNVLEGERLHEGLAAETLLEKLIPDPHCSDLTDSEQQMLATALMPPKISIREELDAEKIAQALESLRARQLRRELERIQQELKAANDDPLSLARKAQRRLEIQKQLQRFGAEEG